MVPFIDKIGGNRSKWFSHIVRRGDLEAIRIAMEIGVKGREGEE